MADLVPGVDDPLEAWAFERAAAVASAGRGSSPVSPGCADSRASSRRFPRRTAMGCSMPSAGTRWRSTSRASMTRAWSARVRCAVSVTVLRIVGTWAVAPLLVSAAILNAPAIAIVVIVDHFVTVPVTKGTVRALIALIVFPATWITVAVLSVGGGFLVVLLVIGHAATLLLGLWLLEGDADAVRRWWQQRRAHAARARPPCPTRAPRGRRCGRDRRAGRPRRCRTVAPTICARTTVVGGGRVVGKRWGACTRWCWGERRGRVCGGSRIAAAASLDRARDAWRHRLHRRLRRARRPRSVGLQRVSIGAALLHAERRAA